MLTDQMTAASDRQAPNTETDAVLRPAGLFRDGMVLQRNRPIPVWGTAHPGRRVVCSLGKLRAVTFSNPEGRFFLKLPSCPAAENLTLILNDGISECRIGDVAVGEVFLLAGQSNMEYDLSQHPQQPLEADRFPVRLFRVKLQAYPGGMADVQGDWRSASVRRGFSSVGYFFAARFSQLELVPVGLIDVSRGGVGIETFIPEEELCGDDFFGPLLQEYEAERFAPESNPENDWSAFSGSARLLRTIEQHQSRIPGLPDPLRDWMKPSFDDGRWQTQDLPDSWSLAGHPHTGRFLYRKKVKLPQNWLGRELTLSLGCVDRADVTYFNGTEIGRTGRADRLNDWNTVRVYAVPAACNNAAEAVIAVDAAQLCSICTHGGLTGPEPEMFLALGPEKLPLSGEWKLIEAFDGGIRPMEKMASAGVSEAKSWHMIYDNCIQPIRHFALSGILWYQGEANTLCYPEQYDRLLSLLIRGWRRNLSPRADFLIFQLPGFQRPHLYSGHSIWALIRDAQLRTALKETGMPPVILTDCGDCENIHPPEKRLPGFRAAEQLWSKRHGQPLKAGAYLRECRKTASGFELVFETFGSPLQAAAGADSGLAGVAENGAVIPLSISEVKPSVIQVEAPPEKLRFIACGWCENPQNVKLKTASGLPVFPFRLPIG